MFDAERELFKLGIPAKTRHNEVAPGQFEIAPVFEKANLATDHQQLLMVTLKRVAEKYGMAVLFHEKPFAGINGSGKHVNFSLGNATEGNLLNPGDTPHDNAQFLVFCGAVIRAVHRHGGLLRTSVASASNDHRLGANEAPPAIISIFLGEQLTDVFDQIAKGGATQLEGDRARSPSASTRCRSCKTDPGDRNRTSPFAFTGNRFEFRAPGSSQTIAGPMVIINTIIAESLDFIATELETAVAAGTDLNAAIQTVLEQIMTTHGSVIFNGDGYSEDWQVEAESRGPAEPPHDGRRAPAARDRRGEGALLALRRAEQPRAAEPARRLARAVRAERRCGGALHARDREDDRRSPPRCATKRRSPRTRRACRRSATSSTRPRSTR